MAEEPSSRSTFDLDARLQVTASEGGRTREMSIALLTVESAELVIGRSRSADLSLQDEYISHRHLRIVFRRGQHWVEDLGSTHGSLLNEKPVIRSMPLEPGDVVSVGKSKLEYACTKRTLEKLPEMRVPEKTVLTLAPGSGRLPGDAAPDSEVGEATAIGPGKSATGATGAAASPKPAQASAGKAVPAPEPLASAPATSRPTSPAAAGTSAAAILFAVVTITAIVALLCYLAWQLFFADAA